MKIIVSLVNKPQKFTVAVAGEYDAATNISEKYFTNQGFTTTPQTVVGTTQTTQTKNAVRLPCVRAPHLK